MIVMRTCYARACFARPFGYFGASLAMLFSMVSMVIADGDLDGEHENCDDNGGCDHAMPWWGYMFIVVALIIVIVSLLCWCYNKDRTVDEDRREEGSRSRRRNRQRRRQPRSDQHVSVKPAMKGEKSGPSTAPPSYDELSPSTTAYSYEYQGSR